MDKLIILSGPAKCGKTATLYNIIDILSRSCKELRELVRDDMCRVVYLRVGEHKVGVITEGNVTSVLKRGFKLLQPYACDVIFCSSRTQQGTVDFLRQIIYGYHDMIDVLPYNKAIYKPANKEDERIVNMIIANQLLRYAGLET